MFKQNKVKPAFTLFEVLIAIIFVGLAISALVATNGYLTTTNGAAMDLSTAEFLIEQVKELTAILPLTDPQTETTSFGPEEATLSLYDDLDDFDNSVFPPPINSKKETLTDLSAFTQQVTIENINQSNFEQTVSDHGSDFIRITVSILKNSQQICSSSWIRVNLTQ